MAKKTTKSASPKGTKTAKTAKAPAAQVKKDDKGRFWLVPKCGGAEVGPFDTKAQALAAKNDRPAAETKPTKKAKAASAA